MEKCKMDIVKYIDDKPLPNTTGAKEKDQANSLEDGEKDEPEDEKGEKNKNWSDEEWLCWIKESKGKGTGAKGLWKPWQPWEEKRKGKGKAQYQWPQQNQWKQQ